MDFGLQPSPPEQAQHGSTLIFDRDILFVSCAKFHSFLTFSTMVVIIWTYIPDYDLSELWYVLYFYVHIYVYVY